MRPARARSAATALLALLLLAWAAPAFAATVTVAWDPNPEEDIAGYHVSYGTQSGVYTATIDVGNVTSWPLSLGPGRYYFAVQARNTSDLLSAYSPEVVHTVLSAPAVSVTAANKVYDATTTATITGCTLTGVLGGETVSCSAAAATFASVSVGTGKTVTATGVTLVGASAGNYTLSDGSATTTANITPATVTAAVTAANKVYDGTTAATASCALTGVIGADAVTCSGTANFDTAGGGKGKTVTVSGITLTDAAASNYTLASTTATTTADILILTPTISSLSPTSGAVGASVTMTGTGFGSAQETSTVTFNGVPATPTSWSGTSIVTSVPIAATTGIVTVTVGAVASNGVPFTVVPTAPTEQPSMTVDKSSLNFGAMNSGTSFTSQTPAQTVNISQAGTQSPVTWTAASDAPWLTVSPTSGSGPAALSIGVQYVSTLPPAGSASVTGAITVTYTGSATATSAVITRLNLPAAAAPATGVIDTPAADATGLQGSIAVTGWAVDDIAVDRVEVWRDLQLGESTAPFAGTPSDPRRGKVFVGHATLVDGARTDIETLHPTMPRNSRGGWGYLLLTWGLPNQGNGTYTLHAIAFDADGHAATLGQKTIGIANALADKPFGSIDTPGTGGTVSGTVMNFGWALTPGTACRVPATGVQVSIDSGPLQPVAFGDVRSDVAALFGGFANGGAAGGHYVFDTTALANGVHTIGWLITDDCNRAEGVGSRFFTVHNSSVVPSPAAAIATRPAARLVASVASSDPVVITRGFGELGVTLDPDATGLRVVSLEQGERIEVRLPSGYDEAWQLMAGERRALPIGAAWDPASHTFAWQPAAAFLGDYELVFVRGSETIRVRISVS